MSFKCLNPRIAIQYKEGEKPTFLKSHNFEFSDSVYSKVARVLLIPCGHCKNCISKKSTEWTSRLLKEAEKHKYCYFITLTYSSLYNEETGEIKDINKRDIQLFLKRYRKNFGVDLTYYITGEHGETTGRPHYHAIFFQDKEISDLRYYSNNLFISDSFAKCWSYGNCLISKQVNERSIKYTIAYTMKKIGEEKIVLMSKGIGLDYFKNNKESIKSHNGFYVVDGFKQGLPQYFIRKLKESNDIEDIKYLDDREIDNICSHEFSGSYLDELHNKFLIDYYDKTTKGKGVF